MSSVTVAPDASRLEWVHPCPVSFFHDPHMRRVVRFGTGRYGTHNVTVNGVKGELGCFEWGETERRSWKFQGGRIRRLGRVSGYLSDDAHRKVRTALEPLVTRLAETNTVAYQDAFMAAAEERLAAHTTTARRRSKSAALHHECAELSEAIASGAATVTPTPKRLVDIPQELRDGALPRHAVGEIRIGGGTAGWVVAIGRRGQDRFLFLPEHAVTFR